MMAAASPPRHFKRPLHRRTPSSLEIVQEETSNMATPEDADGSGLPKSRSEPQLGVSELSARPTPGDSTHAGSALLDEPVSSTNPQPLSTPGLSRSASFSNSSYHDESDFEDAAFFPPVEKLTMFDFVENLALSQRIEKIQSSIASQTERIKNQAKNRGITKDRVVEEWRRRVPSEAEQLEKYKRRMRHSVDRLNRRWNESLTVTAREKASFIAAVMNIFVSGYLVGCHPDLLPHWYTAQLLYFMPLRFFTYHKKGYHYFLADLCYFVNILLVLSVWVFPQSKRLFIATYCLCMGNNAVAIVMWRNSLVFHSMDKVVSLFIHIMPCVTLHCLVHLLSPEYQQEHYPAIYDIRHSDPTSPHHYSLLQMMLWATVPYAFWQLGYHFLITVRRRDKIAAGRPTSFTWLRKSYAKTWIGKIVLSLPDFLQEPAFMFIQYSYAVLTMLPCPVWFWYRWPSGLFLSVVFIWSVYNGATYYIDVFGNRFQKELEQLKADMARWQASPEGGFTPFTPMEGGNEKQLGYIPPLEGSTSVKPVDGETRERK
ncbi:f-box protein [Alternaria alternata]|nr:f-box protein [Alternaria alternata]